MSNRLTKVDELLGQEDRLGRIDSLLGVEESHITIPQKIYKPINRLSRGLKIIKKIKDKAGDSKQSDNK